MSGRDPTVLPGPGVHLIEASAGTGKTHALAQLYLAAVVGDGRLPAQILVVTFTEAAAGELQVRVHLMLRDADALLAGNPPEDRDTRAVAELLEREVPRAGSRDAAHARVRAALARYDERRVSTIHAFAAWVLAEYPMETGVVPGPVRLVDGTSRWREAADDLWRERVTGADGAAFAAAFESPGKLAELARPFRQFPLARTIPDVSDADLERAVARLADALPPAIAAWTSGAEPAFQALLRVNRVLARGEKEGYHPSNVNAALAAWQAYFAAGAGESGLDPWARLFTTDVIEASRTDGAIRSNTPPPRHPVYDALNELWLAHRQVHAIRKARRITGTVAELERRARALMGSAGERSFDDLIGLLHGAVHGTEGATLTDALRQRLPLALIDEFQDTDARQYEIFRAIYVAPAEPAPTLILVGDPKQSIYRFRGGDVYAYRSAQADVPDAPARLARNHRSEPLAVAAVNALFRGVSFLLDFVQYHEVQPVEPGRRLLRDPRLEAGLVLWDAGVGAGRGHTQDALADWAIDSCADEIVRLLSGGVTVETDGRAAPMRAEDIAVLLPRNRDVQRVARVLEARGVGVALEARSSVYASDSARDLYTLLSACAHPDDAGLARAALAAPGFDWTAGQLLSPDEGAYTEARATFRRWHAAWLSHGHDAVLAPLLARLAPVLARREDGARRITDLRHLVERLGAAPVSTQAPASLLAYLGERVAGGDLAEEEADMLRPEPGEARVRVMTAHKSKGLEFGVVFLPLAWHPSGVDRGEVVAFHDDEGRVCLDLGGDPASAERARREQMADALRVAYVTLTRARHRTYAVAAKIRGGSGAGLMRVLFGDRPELEFFGAEKYAGELSARIDAMRAGGTVLLCALPESDGRKLDPGPPPPVPEAAALSRAVPSREPTWSYSALKRLGEQQQGASEAAPLPGADDELAIGEQTYRGARFGRCFHELMERVDFHAGADALDPALLRRAIQRHGLDAGAEPLLRRLLAATLAAELMPGVALHSLGPGRCGREVPFLLGLHGARVSELAALLARYPEYERSGAALAADPGRLSGWLRGYLDLVFEADGRYYVLDYKTDVLAGVDAYAPAALETEVAARGYDLQYLLYSVALRRWLRQRHGSGGEARMGGAVYAFVRGLGEPGQGVFRKSPDPRLLDELEALLAGDAP